MYIILSIIKYKNNEIIPHYNNNSLKKLWLMFLFTAGWLCNFFNIITLFYHLRIKKDKVLTFSYKKQQKNKKKSLFYYKYCVYKKIKIHVSRNQFLVAFTNCITLHNTKNTVFNNEVTSFHIKIIQFISLSKLLNKF